MVAFSPPICLFGILLFSNPSCYPKLLLSPMHLNSAKKWSETPFIHSFICFTLNLMARKRSTPHTLIKVSYWSSNINITSTKHRVHMVFTGKDGRKKKVLVSHFTFNSLIFPWEFTNTKDLITIRYPTVNFGVTSHWWLHLTAMLLRTFSGEHICE